MQKFNERARDDDEIDLKLIFLPILKRWKWFVVISVFSIFLGISVTQHFPDFKNTSQLYIADKDSGVLQSVVSAISIGSGNLFGKAGVAEGYLPLFLSDKFNELLVEAITKSSIITQNDRDILQDYYNKFLASNSDIKISFEQWLIIEIGERIKVSATENVIQVTTSFPSESLSTSIANIYVEVAQKHGIARESRELSLALDYLNNQVKESENQIVVLSNNILNEQASHAISAPVIGSDIFYDSAMGNLKQLFDEVELRINENLKIIKNLKTQGTGSTSTRSMVSALSSENELLNSRAQSLAESIQVKESEKSELLKGVQKLGLFSKNLDFEIEKLKELMLQKTKVDIINLTIETRFVIQNYAVLTNAKKSIPNFAVILTTLVLANLFMMFILFMLELLYPKIYTKDTFAQIQGEYLGSLQKLGGKNALGIVDVSQHSLPPSYFNHSGVQQIKSLRSRIENKASKLQSKSEFLEKGFMLCVTSPGPGVGKTLVSANIAWSLAQLGYKVLLLDSDAYACSLSKRFHLDAKSGLTDLLNHRGITKENEIDSKIFTYQDGASNIKGSLHIMPVGSDKNLELAISKNNNFSELIKNLKKRYDRIVVDTPPSLIIQDCREFFISSDLILCISSFAQTTIESVNSTMLNLPPESAEKTFHLINKSNSSSNVGSVLNFGNPYKYYYEPKNLKKVS